MALEFISVSRVLEYLVGDKDKKTTFVDIFKDAEIQMDLFPDTKPGVEKQMVMITFEGNEVADKSFEKLVEIAKSNGYTVAYQVQFIKTLVRFVKRIEEVES